VISRRRRILSSGLAHPLRLRCLLVAWGLTNEQKPSRLQLYDEGSDSPAPKG